MACVEAAIPVPDSRKKVDELFLFWLSEPSTQEMLRKELAKVCGVPVSEVEDATQGSVTSSLLTSVLRPASPNMRTPSPPPSSSSLSNKSPKSPRARHRSPRKTHKSPSGSSLREKLKLGKYAEIIEETDYVDEQQTLLHPLQHKTTALPTDKEEKQRERSHSPIPPAAPKKSAPPKNHSQLIPKFYFPHGRPSPGEDMEKVMKDVAKVFQEFPKGEATEKDFHMVVKV